MRIPDALVASMRNEYLWIIVALIAWIALQYLIVIILEAAESKGRKIGLGFAVIYAYVRFGLTCLIVFLLFCANPIRILITRWSDILDVTNVVFRIVVIAIILLPLPIALLYIFFGRKIGNYLYHKRYYTGKGAYTVAEEAYRSPAEFRDELENRGLYFNDDTSGFVARLGEGIPDFDTEYYPEATIMPVEGAEFHDDIARNKVVFPVNKCKYPAYVYNAILLLPETGSRLCYMPLARYEDFPYRKMSFLPHKEDYYIECKILYVDGNIYALIGVCQSMDVRESFDQFQKPYYMLLSETNDITTYYEGKYYPNGAIYNECGGFTMLPNTREQSFGYPGKPVNYPVRVVERVDLATINRIASELQAGILKESIEYHRKKQKEREQAKSISRES